MTQTNDPSPAGSAPLTEERTTKPLRSEGTSSAPIVARSTASRLATALSFRRISAVYILAGLILLFGIWVPETFLTESTFKTLLDGQALTAIVAIGLVLPLAAGAFDLSIGATVGAGAMAVAWLLAEQGFSTVPAILLTLVFGALIGVGSGLLVVYARIDSFIATLAMSSVLLAVVGWLSDNQQILNMPTDFQSLGTSIFLGLTYPVWIMIGLAALVWYVLERTPVGRRVYAVGGNPDAARLAGVRTGRITIACLAAAACLAAVAGILTTSRSGVGDPTTGPSFLLPAFAAAFLGSTQIKQGRYNIVGTVLAVYVLAVGVKGLQLAGAPLWIPDLFNGLALMLAVGLAKSQGRLRRRRAVKRATATP